MGVKVRIPVCGTGGARAVLVRRPNLSSDRASDRSDLQNRRAGCDSLTGLQLAVVKTVNERANNLANWLLESAVIRCSRCRCLSQPGGGMIGIPGEHDIVDGVCDQCLNGTADAGIQTPVTPPKLSFYPSAGGPSSV